MRSGTFVHRFGPFEFDPATGRLFRGSSLVRLSDPQSAMLRTLIAKAGQVVTKTALIEAGWGNVAVTPDSVKQSISRLRKALSDAPGGMVFIQTVPNRGYRFAERLERGERHDPVAPAGAGLAAYEAFVQGRADLYTLKLEQVHRARAAFERALELEPEFTAAHIGLANACGLIFEASRVDGRGDRESLRQGVRHAERATALAPSSGAAWSTLAFLLGLQGNPVAAAVAACKAIELEPNDWLHHLRLAYVSWGEERCRAAYTVLALCPGLALAHWLIATVLIARGAFDTALGVLADGCRAQDEQSPSEGGFPAVGLHLLRGLVLAARHRLDEAAAEFRRELSFVTSGQLYGRECAANTWYALGAIAWRQRRHDDAEASFRKALDAEPGHLCAMAALGHSIPVPPAGDPRVVPLGIARAVALVRAGRHVDAAAEWRGAIMAGPPVAGWILPVEPVIDAGAHPEIWRDVLALVRQRAV